MTKVGSVLSYIFGCILVSVLLCSVAYCIACFSYMRGQGLL